MFTIDVEGIDGKHTTLYSYGDCTLLSELENNNILMNYNCRQGHCGSCILLLMAGDVSHLESLVPLAQGEILACRATPVSDVRIKERVS